MARRGRWYPRNRSKYRGDVRNIVYRSGWEAAVLTWLDENSDVEWYSSEETIVPYRSPYDQKPHRYYIDFTVKFKGKNPLLIEVKPRKYTIPPKKVDRSRRTINEVVTYGVNQAKWKAARQFANKKGYTFQVWTEQALKGLGIM